MKFLRRINTFLYSLFWHIYRGFPKSSQDIINQRLSICKNCENFDFVHSQCLICGCNINDKKIFMNKLAWADQKCPINKW